jgi:hypothetical protein
LAVLIVAIAIGYELLFSFIKKRNWIIKLKILN